MEEHPEDGPARPPVTWRREVRAVTRTPRETSSMRTHTPETTMNLRIYMPKTIALITFALIMIGGVSLLFGSPIERPAFANDTIVPVPANLPEDGWTGGPRECDVAAGATTSCVFMD
jgi:hypothetical protein